MSKMSEQTVIPFNALDTSLTAQNSIGIAVGKSLTADESVVYGFKNSVGGFVKIYGDDNEAITIDKTNVVVNKNLLLGDKLVATQDFVTKKIGDVDHSTLATKTYVDTEITKAVTGVDHSTLATKDYVATEIGKIDHSSYTTKTYVDGQINDLSKIYRPLTNNNFTSDVLIGTTEANKNLTVNGKVISKESTIGSAEGDSTLTLLTVNGGSKVLGNLEIGSESGTKTLTLNAKPVATQEYVDNKVKEVDHTVYRQLTNNTFDKEVTVATTDATKYALTVENTKALKLTGAADVVGDLSVSGTSTLGNVAIGSADKAATLTLNTKAVATQEYVDTQIAAVDHSSYRTLTNNTFEDNVIIGASDKPKNLTVNGNVTIGDTTTSKTLTLNGADIATKAYVDSTVSNIDHTVYRLLTNNTFENNVVIGSAEKAATLTLNTKAVATEEYVNTKVAAVDHSTYRKLDNNAFDKNVTIGTSETALSLKLNGKDVTTKEYVDTQIAGVDHTTYRTLTNNTFDSDVAVGAAGQTKKLTLNGADVATKTYVDTKVASVDHNSYRTISNNNFTGQVNIGTAADKNGSLFVNGILDLTNTTVVGGNFTASSLGNAGVNGATAGINMSRVNIEDLQVNKSAVVNGTTKFNEAVHIGSTDVPKSLLVNGRNLLTELDNVKAGVQANTDGKINTHGDVTFDGDVTVGSSTAAKTLTVTGDTTLKNVFIKERLIVEGDAAFTDGVLLNAVEILDGGLRLSKENKQNFIKTNYNDDMSLDFKYFTNDSDTTGISLMTLRNPVGDPNGIVLQQPTFVNGALTVTGNITATGTITANSSTTVTHFCPIDAAFRPSNFRIGCPVFMTGRVYRSEITKNNEYKWLPATSDHPSDCISSVKPSGTWLEYLGICVQINEHNNTIKFATHGDYMYYTTNSQKYKLGDMLLCDGTIVTEQTPITMRLMHCVIGIVTGFIDEHYISLIKF